MGSCLLILLVRFRAFASDLVMRTTSGKSSRSPSLYVVTTTNTVVVSFFETLGLVWLLLSSWFSLSDFLSLGFLMSAEVASRR